MYKEIPFTKPYLTGNEVLKLKDLKKLCGDGEYTKKVHQWLESKLHLKKALYTHSCTAALEMSALLLDIKPGDEIIMPSFTFVSTANAFVLRGGVPVFVDIRKDTLNIDETLIEEAITKKTRAIVPIHYAGVSAEMDAILKIAEKHSLLIIEDAAQGLLSTYKQKYLGSIGTFGALSFHETKNIISGEGGALLINDEAYIEKAEVIREKGTNRSRFIKGHVDKYTWQDVGSSYLPSDILAAFLMTQLENAEHIIRKRLNAWNLYHERLASLPCLERFSLPHIPEDCTSNGHIYYIILPNSDTRNQLSDYLNANNIKALSHYAPLHNSPAGMKYGRYTRILPVTELVAGSILRLPLYSEMDTQTVDIVVEKINTFFKTY